MDLRNLVDNRCKVEQAGSKAEQDKFDEASEHGLDAEVSAAWAKSIDQRLKQLEKYSS